MTSLTSSHVTQNLLMFQKKKKNELPLRRLFQSRCSAPPLLLPHGRLWHLHRQSSRANSDAAASLTARRNLARHVGVCDHSFLRKLSQGGSWTRSLLLICCQKEKEDKDGARECVSRFAFAGLCDNLQQRVMSRWCPPLQQPLRRVSKDHLSFSLSPSLCLSPLI